MVSDITLKPFAETPTLEEHAANRLMFGPKPNDLEYINSIGYNTYLDQQLHPDSIDDSETDTILASHNFNTFEEDWQTLFDRRSASPSSESYKPIYDVRQATGIRISHSKRQLFERMVNFWYDHFNIYGYTYVIRSLFSQWDNTIRLHALGNFKELLIATAQHPCMQIYLDNYKSTDAVPTKTMRVN
jgi:hypothetical protein